MEELDLEELDLESTPQLKLAGEREEEKPKPKPKPGSKTQKILDAMRKKAEENKSLGEIYPSWDVEASGKGSRVFGVLLEKRTIHMESDRPLYVIDNQVPVHASDRDGDYEDYKGPLTVWCGVVLTGFFDQAEIGKFTYIEYLGRTKGTKNYYNNFVFAQADREELAELAKQVEKVE